MRETLQRLSLGILLIGMASAILLFSDAPRSPARNPHSADSIALHKLIKVAMFQVSAQPIIDEGAAGVLEGLSASGFAESEHFKVTRFNSLGDMATANTIAQDLVGGDYDLVITLTTGALQVMANANKQGQVQHVFGLVSDPVKAGVGIGTDPMDHPSHMVGIGTLPPVDEALRMAKRLNPNLKRVGIPWNPAEVNSEICTLLARKTCKELNLELIETNVENAIAVKEAVESLIERQPDALLVGGDVTVLGAVDLVVSLSKSARIPVLTCMPGNAKFGTLFDVGADYTSVGHQIGRLAARVLNGEPIATIPVEILIPPKLFLNKVALQGLHEGWSFPPDVIEQALSIIDETGQHDKQPAKAATPAAISPTATKGPAKLWELRSISYVNSPDSEDAERGLSAGLKQAGLVEGRDFRLKTGNAQGDIATLNGLVDAALSDRADLLMTISTSALQCAIQRAKGTPIVFTMVANPFAAGVGTSETEHLPGVTGAYGAMDVGTMLPLIRQVMPGAKRLGAIFAPSEVNSVYNHDLLKIAAKQAGYELISVGADSAAEVSDAARSLCDQRIDAICLPNSNLASTSYPALAQAASQSKVPVFGFFSSILPQGAVLVLARDYYDMGVDSGLIAARVIRGESPAAIRLHQTTKNDLMINATAARSYQLTIPELLLKSAKRVISP